MKGILIGFGVMMAFLTAGLYFFSTTDGPQSTPSPRSVDVDRDGDGFEDVVGEPDQSAGGGDVILPYSDNAVTRAIDDGKRPVLFFHADWCPYCRAAEADLRANSSSVPDDVAIFKVDYDTASELKREYGVTSQDAFVQIDEERNKVVLWYSGGQGVSALLSNIQ